MGDNNDQTPFYPASFGLPNIIAVAATDHNDGLASFSNYGVASVDVAAPGVGIRSSIPSINVGAPTQLFPAGATPEEFETGLGDWTHWGSNDQWDLTESVSVSPTHSLADSPADISDFESPEDFAERGIGYCLRDSDTMVGVAYSSLVCSKGIEISIFVLPQHRRKGLATALAGNLLRWCLKHDMDPHWDAANPESCRLAEKLGYVQTGEYEAYILTE